MSMLELHDVSKTYGEGAAEVRALAGVSLSVDEGSMVAVMGPSGSGKSTLLTIAGSLEEPTMVHDACKQGGMAAVVVTHDAELATWADRSVFLRDGQMTDQPARTQLGGAASAGEQRCATRPGCAPEA